MTFTVSRNGDLITRALLQVGLPSLKPAQTGAAQGVSWVNEIGHMLIRTVDIDIGGQRIDRHYGEWMSIWSSLTVPSGKEIGYANMIGNVQSLHGAIQVTGAGATAITANPTHAASGTGVTPARTLFIPLIFWFNRHPGLALPLIALQYHEIKINVEFRSFNELVRGTVDNSAYSLAETSLFVDYIYLDSDERRKFALSKHEYLIEQLQFTGDESLTGMNNKIKTSFNHPVKELVWVVQSSKCTNFAQKTEEGFITGNNVLDWTNWTTSPVPGAGRNPVEKAKLQLNGHDRFTERSGAYFNLVQPYFHHTNCPAPGINVYSFALSPEEHQPSGTLNFSRIDNATLLLNLDADAAPGANNSNIVKVFAVNYNIFRVVSGLGGVAYAS